MAHYSSVRGWLELNEAMVAQVHKLVYEYEQNASAIGTPVEIVKFYMRGWVFPTDHINWTYYVFYGADVRTEHLNLLRSQLITISEKVKADDKTLHSSPQDSGFSEQHFTDFPVGVFYIDDEDGKILLLWELRDGHFFETRR